MPSLCLDILNVYLIDVVSGSIVFSMSHRRAKGPVRIVHSENWLVYSFYNEKIRRNEISEYYLPSFPNLHIHK
jgi:ER membrane protein complex subunit 1